MRMLAPASALALAVISASANAARPQDPCQQRLPHGPQVPAAIVFTSTCGSFRLQRSGHVAKLPRRWLAHHEGRTGRRFGAHLRLRASHGGSIILRLKRKVVWRSAHSYRGTITSVAFGPRLFAFSVWRRGVYLTDLESPERLVVHGRESYPLDFTASGRLVVVSGRVITLVSARGRVVRSLVFAPGRGVSLDSRTDTLYFVSPDDGL